MSNLLIGSNLLNDLRYALRLFSRTPSFAAVAILTLALGIGANTAIFTIVNALLIRPLPYRHADRLVMVWQDLRARGGPADEWATPGNYADWRKEKSIFDEVAVISGWRPTLTGGAEPESIAGEQVSHEYFSVLGVAPIVGRTFTPSDDVPNAPRVAVIGAGRWRRNFGASPAAVGQEITLNGEAHEIIGVVGDGFRPIVNPAAEIWRPSRINTANPARGAIILRAVARLPEGTSLDRAQAAADILARQLEAAFPQFNEKTRFNLTPLHQRVVGDIKPGLLALVGAVGFVLLIACANIANLLLARGSARGRELAVRVALGARRSRVVGQLLTESVFLAVIGGISGFLLGVWAVDALVALAPADAPRLNEIRLDPTVLVFAVLLTFITGLLFGLAPALQHSKGEITNSLRDGGRGTVGGAGRNLRRTLIAAEVALALMLLTGASLLAQTFVHLRSTDLGFKPDNLLAGFINPPPANGYDTAAKYRAFYDQALANARAIPGVENAALASVLPLSGDNDTSFAIEGRPVSSIPSETPVTWYRQVSASYFDTMDIPIKRGRGFEAREAAPSVVVNETFARTYFPGQDALGRRVRFGREDPWFTIIGIAGDVKVRGARESSKVETYIPYWQQTEPGTAVILKAAGNPLLLAAPLRRAVASIDRNVPVSGITTLSQMVSESIDNPRFFATLAAAFAVLAVMLAAIGIYGVMAYVVSQRTTEIGVRMALGATSSDVFGLVVGDGLKLVAVGIVLGAGGSLLMARWLATLLFGVQATDPATLAATAAALLAFATAACLLPARRATRVDPMVALRAE
jgi:putative ABC transport system permease protein